MDEDLRDTLMKLGKLVELRGDCDLFCIVRSDSGLEVVSNVTDYITERGMLKVAEESVIERQHVINMMLRRDEEREAKRAMAAMGGFKEPAGGVN